MIKSLRFRKLSVLILCVSLFCFYRGLSRNISAQSRGAAGVATPREMPRTAYDFVNSVGVNTHLNYFDRTYGNFQMVERELRSIGIRHVRDGAHLLNSDYNKMVYSRWSRLGAIGVRFDAVVDPRSSLGWLTAEKLEYIDELANHTIESFEGSNELDISKDPEWATVARDYQNDLYHAVKSMTNGRSIVVIGPSLAFASKGSSVGDISDRADFGNLHSYPAGKPPSSVLQEQTALAKSMYSEKKIVMTETGYHNALHDHRDQPGVSETAAGKYIPRLFLENFSHGIFRTYLYEFLDEAPDPDLTDFQLHWGLVRSDGSEKPAFTAMKNLMNELNDAAEPEELRPLTYSLSGAAANVHHLLLQKSDGTYVLVLWQESPSYDVRNQHEIVNDPQDVQLAVGQPAGTVIVFEPGALAEPLQTYRKVKSLSLRVPDQPLVVQIALR